MTNTTTEIGQTYNNEIIIIIRWFNKYEKCNELGIGIALTARNAYKEADSKIRSRIRDTNNLYQ